VISQTRSEAAALPQDADYLDGDYLYYFDEQF